MYKPFTFALTKKIMQFKLSKNVSFLRRKKLNELVKSYYIFVLSFSKVVRFLTVHI